MKTCKTCSERWKQVLIKQQLEKSIMEDSKKNNMDKKVNDINVVNESEVGKVVKPNINKIIEDRRKAVLEGKTINK